MATVKEITTMCKEGRIQEAYDLAKKDWEFNPNEVWNQRELGWSLYYLIRKDSETGQYEQLISHLNELQSLDQLNTVNDALIFENVIFWVGYYAKKHLTSNSIDTPIRLSTLFSKFKSYSFSPNKGYTLMLEGFIKCDIWEELSDFFDWWDLKKLRSEDYKPVEISNGRKIMSVAERAYIAKAKALIRKNDLGKIEEFLPEMDELINNHPEMTYPGYFYGKMLLALGATQEDELRVIIPFARKKATEFWVWQLLSEVFKNDQEKRLACLLRAVNCRTQENFLGKVRLKLAGILIDLSQLPLAKFQIDKVTQCYLSQGWRLPNEIDNWIHQPWINSVKASNEAPVDYISITNNILLNGTQEMTGIVTYYDQNSKRANVVIGYENQIKDKIRFKVYPGSVLKLNYITEPDGHIRILHAIKSSLPNDLSYAKIIEGKIKKSVEWPYAFLIYEDDKAFLSPQIVSKYDIKDGENMKALIVYDYDKRKQNWSWVVISINR